MTVAAGASAIYGAKDDLGGSSSDLSPAASTSSTARVVKLAVMTVGVATAAYAAADWYHQRPEAERSRLLWSRWEQIKQWIRSRSAP